MIRKLLMCMTLLLILAAASVTAAQDPAIPTPAPIQPATPEADDSRLAVCVAPMLPGFVPYTVREGDTLPVLLVGVANVTATQLASLNCLDDPYALPVGATIWLPEEALVVSGGLTEAPEDTSAPRGSTIDPESSTPQTFTATNEAGIRFDLSTLENPAYFYACGSLNGDCTRPDNAMLIEGPSAVVIGAFQYAGIYRYRLETPRDDTNTIAEMRVAVTCTHEWLGDVGDLCPDEAARVVFAAFQPFENGAMIWFSDTQLVYVMTSDDGAVRLYEDNFAEGQPDPTAEAPAERFTPARGFGHIWAGLGGAEASGLGWGLAPEVGYDALRQAAGTVTYTTFVTGPDEQVYAITLVPGEATGFWTLLES
ncbi:MAG: LysM peptidoglycan-binding domain-containing protein [Chloroflexi bacterium]|nr:LysM peptidoglycan-binding domain-containing protein [Chloroflexota bacterium]